MQNSSGSATLVETAPSQSVLPPMKSVAESNMASYNNESDLNRDSKTDSNSQSRSNSKSNSKSDTKVSTEQGVLAAERTETSPSTNTHTELDSSIEPQVLAGAEIKNSNESVSSTDSRPISPTDQDSDENPENAGDLKFKKKDLHKSRAQSFQSVLSSASLKSLKQQFTIPAQPQLKRNASTISQSNTKNFQSFIQAPVLSSVTNLRAIDDVEIGQQLPFDHKRDSGPGSKFRRSSALDPKSTDPTSSGERHYDEDGVVDDQDDEDIYKEETTLQQQRLTLNALKKLSLSLAPIIRSDDDEQGPQSRQLTMTSLNSSRHEARQENRQENRQESRPARDLRPVLRTGSSRKLKPYQPAEVDLSSFSSLTRQSKHNSETNMAPPPGPAALERQRAEPQISRPSQAQVERASHSHSSSQTQTQTQSLGQLQTPAQAQTQIQAQSQTQAQTQALASAQPHSKFHAPTYSNMSHSQARAEHLPGTQTQMTADRNSLFAPEGQVSLPQNSRSEAWETKGSGSASNAHFHPSSQNHNSGQQDARQSQSDSLQKTLGSSAKGGHGGISGGSNEVRMSGSRSQSGLMRPSQVATDLHQRGFGQASDMMHGSSFGSTKSHAYDKKLQQINGFRSPMYVPAVLRKTVDESPEFGTEHAGHHAESDETLPTDVGSSATSVKSVDSSLSLEPSASPGVRMSTGPYELNRGHYNFILRAAPTRKHWLKDEAVVQCGMDICRKNFNFFERRHHCRKCGGIYCKEHTSHYLYINHLAQFTTGGRGTLSRVCDNCIDEYNEFMKHEFGVTCHRPSSRESLPPQSSLNKVDYRKEVLASKAGSQIPKKSAEGGEESGASEQLVGSVPANWSWSSF